MTSFDFGRKSLRNLNLFLTCLSLALTPVGSATVRKVHWDREQYRPNFP